MTGERRYTWSERLEADLAVARRENATLREERDNARYVSDFYAGRTLAWRTEAFRLAAKTGEPMQESSGVTDEQLLAEAQAALAASPAAEEPQP